MRIFGAESMNNILQKLGLKDGESIDHPWINKALERAQQKVEARNFDIRKTLLKFDNVLNDQRHVIFSQRNNLINKNEIFKYTDNFLDEISNNLKDDKNKYLVSPKDNELNIKLRSILGKSFEDKEIDKLIKLNDKDFNSKIHDKFDQKRKERIEYLGKDRVQEIEKRIFLQTIDLNWKLHIQYLEQLRQVIGLRSYGQRDPLIEYKKEAFTLFKNLLEKLKTDLITILINLTIIQKKNEEKDTVSKTKKINISDNPNCLLLKKKGEKISRNDRCEATGKKFKQCCGAL